MYYDYFGLKQPPFRITPDTSLFYPGGDRGAVLEALIYAILNGEGMVKVVGEVGSGKTMLCRMLEKELPEKVEVVYLANPSLSPENILHAIAFELKLPVQAQTSRLQVMHNLQEYLLQRHAEDRQVVVFVEEAQAMPIATLEEIRLLSNLETQQSKLLQLVLFGQPELDALISRPEIRQLKERITYSFQLNPFVSEHIRDYVNTRLRASGYRAGEIFDKAAIRRLQRYSKGLLRRVNILADKALLAAYAANTKQVTARHVDQAARDSEFVTWHGKLPRIALVMASILLVFGAALTYWHLGSADRAARDQVLQDTETGQQMGGPPLAEPAFTGDSLPDNPDMSATIEDKMEVSANSKTTIGQAAEFVEDRQRPGTGMDSNIISPPAQGQATPEDANPRRQQATGMLEGTDLEEQILDLSRLIELQDLGDPRLSAQESEQLRQQLKDLPPEVALYQDSAQFSDICKLCWSILYRPLKEAENL